MYDSLTAFEGRRHVYAYRDRGRDAGKQDRRLGSGDRGETGSGGEKGGPGKGGGVPANTILNAGPKNTNTDYHGYLSLSLDLLPE